MRTTRAVIDSLNLSAPRVLICRLLERSPDLYHLNHTPYLSELRREFGIESTNGLHRITVVYTAFGCSIPIKTYHRFKDMGVIEFAGLEGYNDRGEALKSVYGHLREDMKGFNINRLDIAIDSPTIPHKALKRLREKRVKVYDHKHTDYFKTIKEGKKNGYFDVKYYDKAHKEELSSPLYRLEFAFKSSYLKKTTLEDMATLYPKITRTIKDYTGLSIKIESDAA